MGVSGELLRVGGDEVREEEGSEGGVKGRRREGEGGKKKVWDG